MKFCKILSLVTLTVLFALDYPAVLAQSPSAHTFPISEEEASACIDTAMARLGIDIDSMTQPELLNDVLTNDMFLADLRGARSLVEDSLAHPESLEPMLSQIRRSLIQRHPAVSEFICKAVALNLISKIEDNSLVVRTIHHTFLLDKIIAGMYSDPMLMTEVAEHFEKQRVKLGARKGFLGSAIDMVKATGDSFFVIKAKTIDAVFQRFVNIRSKNELAESEAFGSKLCLILNITEAVVTDKLEGRRSNALVGLSLSMNPLDTVTLEGDERVLRYHLSEDWTSLYESWNLAFITGTMDNLHLLYPKLLIPRVIDAPSHDYLFNRTLALYTGINFHLLSQLSGRTPVRLEKAEEISRLWGDINLRYAREHFRAEHGYELESFRGRLKAGVLTAGEEMLKLVRNPFSGVPKVCM